MAGVPSNAASIDALAIATARAETMRAMVLNKYGSPDDLTLEEVEMPAIGDNDVVVRVHAASVCQGDVHLMTGKPYLLRLVGFGLLRPKHHIPGQNVAGRVEAVGRNVAALRPGDDVYGEVPFGAFAEYVSAPADKMAPKPSNLTYEQAAAVPTSGMTALQALRDVANLQPGQSVLINGASGGVGAYAVQIAKALGAEVTAVCSTRHVDLLRSIGADHIIDYTKDDFAGSGQRHDVMLDLVGNRSITDCKRVLKPKGKFVSCAGSPDGNWIGPVVGMLKVMLNGAFVMMQSRRDDLMVLKQLIEDGKVTPVIERRYVLSEVAAALRHVATGHAQGTTVISD